MASSKVSSNKVETEKRPLQLSSKNFSEQKFKELLQGIPQVDEAREASLRVAYGQIEVADAITELLRDGIRRTETEICLFLAGRFTYERVQRALHTMIVLGEVRQMCVASEWFYCIKVSVRA